MKKFLLLILTLFLFFACYYIDKITEDNDLKYLLIGDNLVNNPYIIKNTNYRNDFVNMDYRIIDLLNILKYNEELKINNSNVSIHQQLRESDVLVISIGMNDIYYKLNNNTNDIYTYINRMIDNLENIFLIINKYDYKQVFFLGYYNDKMENEMLFKYLNNRVSRVIDKNKMCFVDIDKMIKIDKKEHKKLTNFLIDDEGYKKIYDFIVENLENC